MTCAISSDCRDAVIDFVDDVTDTICDLINKTFIKGERKHTGPGDRNPNPLKHVKKKGDKWFKKDPITGKWKVIPKKVCEQLGLE